MMTPEITHAAITTDRIALPPRKPDPDEENPNIERGYDKAPNTQSLIFEGAMHRLGTELIYSSHLIKDDQHNEKLHALIDGYESATFKLGMDVESYDKLPIIALEALPVLSVEEIKGRFESDLHAAKQRVAQELLATNETSEKLAAAHDKMNERRLVIAAQLESAQRDDVKRLIRSELNFIDTALSFNQKVDSGAQEAEKAEDKEGDEEDREYIEPPRSPLHQAVFKTIQAMPVDAIDEQSIEEMHATSNILTKQSRFRERSSKELESLKDALLKHRFALIAQKMDMSQIDFNGPLGATLYMQMQFINGVIDTLNKSTSTLPSTAELEERVNNLTSETMSPARGINLGIVKKLSDRALELAKAAGF